MTNKNFKSLKESTNKAKQGVKTAKSNIFYFVNNLNRLYAKNELCNNEDLKPLGKMVRAKAFEFGFEVSITKPFNIYMFKNVNGVICYRYTKKVKASKAFAISETITIWQPVKLSENGLIDAYKYVLGIDAKAADKAESENEKAAKKVEKNEKAAARKELKKQQQQAIKDYNQGKICVAEFAEIMAKAV